MPSRYGRGIGLQIAGRGIQGLGAQLPGIIAGAREEEEDPLVRKKLELDVAAGEQKIAKGLREEETEKLKAAKAEALEKKKRMFVEILNDTDMKGWLAEVGKDPAKAKEVMGAAGISPAVSEGREEISMEGLAETEQKMAQPAPFKQQVAAVRQKMPGAEFEHAEEQPFKAFFGREAEEKEQAGKVAEKQASQEFKTEERLAGEEFKKTEKEKDRQLRRSLDALKQSNSEGEGKKYERKSTTTAAKMTSDLGFALGKLQNLRSIVETGDADILNTSILGEFTDPTLKDAILQLTEFHGREQSGAAISNSEWRNFKKQILNRKFLLTEAGRKTALDNLDDFVGRYFAKGEAIANSPTWFDEYQASKKRGIEKIGGKKIRDYGKEYGF